MCEPTDENTQHKHTKSVSDEEGLRSSSSVSSHSLPRRTHPSCSAFLYKEVHCRHPQIRLVSQDVVCLFFRDPSRYHLIYTCVHIHHGTTLYILVFISFSWVAHDGFQTWNSQVWFLIIVLVWHFHIGKGKNHGLSLFRPVLHVGCNSFELNGDIFNFRRIVVTTENVLCRACVCMGD